MKKLLALFIIGGLLCTITGCPPATTTTVPKKAGESPKGSTPPKDMKSGSGGMKERMDKEKADKEKADKEKADKEKADKEKADKEKKDKK